MPGSGLSKSQSHADSACAASVRPNPTPGPPTPETRNPIPDPGHLLLSPGTATVSADGIVTIAGADLAFAGLGDRCTPRIHALEHTVALTPGTLRILRHHGGTSSLDLADELDTIGHDSRKAEQYPPVLVRVTDGERRSLELRFGPKSLKGRALKNKARKSKRVSGLGAGVSGKAKKCRVFKKS